MRKFTYLLTMLALALGFSVARADVVTPAITGDASIYVKQSAAEGRCHSTPAQLPPTAL